MVIDDLDLFGAVLAPNKADPPLIVDSDAVLTAAIASQGFESVPRRRAEVREPSRRIQHIQLAQCDGLDISEWGHGFAPI